MTMRALVGAVATARMAGEQPACADRLDLVDAAMARTRGPAAHELAERVCPSCPAAIARECLLQGLNGGEHGTWGATLETQRRRVKPLSYTHNLRDRRSPT